MLGIVGLYYTKYRYIDLCRAEYNRILLDYVKYVLTLLDTKDFYFIK